MVNKTLREINTDSVYLDKILDSGSGQWLDPSKVPEQRLAFLRANSRDILDL